MDWRARVRPLEAYRVRDSRTGLMGFLAIDALVGGRSFGGVRLVPYLSEKELIHSARTMSMKSGFLNLRSGGAKAGIEMPSRLGQKRKEVARAFGEKLAPIIKTRRFSPGMDMGTTMEDIMQIAEGAGVKMSFQEWKNKSHLYTAWSVLAAAKAACEERGTGLSGKKVAIEGLGKVGSALAIALEEEGAKIVAVSNSQGAICNWRGLCARELCTERLEKGSDWVLNYKDAKKIGRAALLELPVGILFPCARAFSVNWSNVRQIKSPIICPAANAPYTFQIEDALRKRGILAMPDFLCNSGGVLGSRMEHELSEQKIEGIISSAYSEKVRRIFELARAMGLPPAHLARDIATRNMDYMMATGLPLLPRATRFLIRRLPTVLREPLSQRHYARLLDSD